MPQSLFPLNRNVYSDALMLAPPLYIGLGEERELMSLFSEVKRNCTKGSTSEGPSLHLDLV